MFHIKKKAPAQGCKQELQITLFVWQLNLKKPAISDSRVWCEVNTELV